jgi:hypothetical protein
LVVGVAQTSVVVARYGGSSGGVVEPSVDVVVEVGVVNVNVVIDLGSESSVVVARYGGSSGGVVEPSVDNDVGLLSVEVVEISACLLSSFSLDLIFSFGLSSFLDLMSSFGLSLSFDLESDLDLDLVYLGFLSFASAPND